MRGIALAIWCLGSVVACGPGARSNEGLPCSAGQTQCDGNELLTCVDGHYANNMKCANVCVPDLGCTLCVPGTGTCNGNTSTACNMDGMGYSMIDCDPVQGETCDATSGVCTGACAPNVLGQSYIGCEYFPTVTGNIVGNEFDFAVALANTGNQNAMVTIEDGALTTPIMATVPPNTLLVQKLPWQQELKLCNDMPTPEAPCSTPLPSAVQATKGAYHLRSTSPITVYQFNSLEYALNSDSDFSYTNDASLLLPTNVWRKDYFVAGWEQIAGQNPAEMAVTASQDGTMVTINSKAATIASGAVPAFTPGTPNSVMLNAGDVLELTSLTGDFTGSEVTSTAPVEVIGGNYCADIPEGVCCCDHVEESMFGVDQLGENYIVNAPAVTTEPSGKIEVIRIIATQANTTLTYNPPQTGAPASIANPGDFVEIDGNVASFEIQASAHVLVAQYMEGEEADGAGTGDPAEALAVPVEQFRSSYTFQAPTNYESNYVDVTAPMGAMVMLDNGTPLTFTPIGTTGYGLSRVYPLTAGPNNDGNHTIMGDMPFGITVYGYGQYTSYWYPGGLNLNTVID
ncbi:MAG TPA: IgGFc-binding protein [Kofleriaceae bacterium]|nr:IgGFc-binding protein [Kofleriaceae bacterium]